MNQIVLAGGRQQEHRRDFIRRFPHLLSAAMLAQSICGIAAPAFSSTQTASVPWFRRTYRWGQTNINEIDPRRYDLDWWRGYWKETRTQGLVINAGGIVAYYPSRNPLQYRAEFLDGRDLYGELVRAAHEDGLAVLARMDSNRAGEEFYQAHPAWFSLDSGGRPYRADDRYVSCIDGPYYDEYLPSVLREVIEWERPEGFTDNSWSGLGRGQICYCQYSRKRFKEATGHDLPLKPDWDDPVYREWVRWGFDRRIEVWDLNNRTVQEAAGPDCLWLGMLGGDLVSQGRQLRDIRAICKRSPMVMLDDQSRSVSVGFHENAEMGKRLHGLLGWDKIMPESMAMYQRAPTFRKTAASKVEARLWMVEGFAGTIQPWWHHVGAYQWDRRQFTTVAPVYQWYGQHEEFPVNRSPIAPVGVVYSQRNADFYGRDDADERVAQPYYGVIKALVESRIPYLPVDLADLDSGSSGFSLLILPNLASVSELEAETIKRFVEGGGALLATDETSLYDPEGSRRDDFLLGDLLGVRFRGKELGSLGPAQTWEGEDHTYLRLHPGLGEDVYGPNSGAEPTASPLRHEVLNGFEETDILPFGGRLVEVEALRKDPVPATFIPPFPTYPPETSWMRTPDSGLPALVLNETMGGARLAYLAADLDRRFQRDNLPDHGKLLQNLVRWALRGSTLLSVDGPGLVDCHLYRQGNRVILHVVNLTGPGAWRVPAEEVVPVGPLAVTLQELPGSSAPRIRHLVSGKSERANANQSGCRFTIPSVGLHEVVVIE